MRSGTCELWDQACPGIPDADHRYSRQEWDADRAFVIETRWPHHRLHDFDHFVLLRGDAGLVDQAQRDLLPVLNAVGVDLV